MSCGESVREIEKEVRFIKKGNVERHLKGGCHEHALKIEAKLAKKRTNEPSKNEPPNKQPVIDFAMKKNVAEPL